MSINLRSYERQRLPSRFLVRFGAILFCSLMLFAASATVSAQETTRAARLPTAKTIIEDYVKAVGGAKRLREIKDKTRRWTITRDDKTIGSLTMQSRAPLAKRTDLTLNGVTIIRAADSRAAWIQNPDGKLRTLSAAVADAVRLEAALDASRMVDLQKLNIVAETIGEEMIDGERAFVVELKFAEGTAKFHYFFGAKSKLVLKIVDPVTKEIACYSDYRKINKVLESHRLEVPQKNASPLVFTLEDMKINQGLTDELFEPLSSNASVSPR